MTDQLSMAALEDAGFEIAPEDAQPFLAADGETIVVDDTPPVAAAGP